MADGRQRGARLRGQQFRALQIAGFRQCVGQPGARRGQRDFAGRHFPFTHGHHCREIGDGFGQHPSAAPDRASPFVVLQAHVEHGQFPLRQDAGRLGYEAIAAQNLRQEKPECGAEAEVTERFQKQDAFRHQGCRVFRASCIPKRFAHRAEMVRLGSIGGCRAEDLGRPVRRLQAGFHTTGLEQRLSA